MTAAPDVEFTAALAVADRAMKPILCDHGIWAEEMARTDAAPLSWPPQIKMIDPEIGDHAGLIQTLAVTAVEMVIVSMGEQLTGEPPADDPVSRAKLREIVQALDQSDPEVQIVLRVVNRAIQAADMVLCDQFGGKRGAHRLSGKREFLNWVKAREVEAAVRSGIPRAEALAALGFSRAAAYRAMNRKR